MPSQLEGDTDKDLRIPLVYKAKRSTLAGITLGEKCAIKKKSVQ
jgi:hypothetical protein